MAFAADRHVLFSSNDYRVISYEFAIISEKRLILLRELKHMEDVETKK